MGIEQRTRVEYFLVCDECGAQTQSSQSRAEVDALAHEAGWQFHTGWNGQVYVGRWLCPDCQALERFEDELAYEGITLDRALALLGASLTRWLRDHPDKTVDDALSQVLDSIAEAEEQLPMQLDADLPT